MLWKAWNRQLLGSSWNKNRPCSKTNWQ